MSPTLVRRAYGIFAAILDVAVKDKRIPSNPARGVSLPRKIGREHRYLTHEQVHVLAQSSDGNAILIRLLAYTGLRWGEATGLRVSDIDIPKRRVNVNVNAVFVKGKIIVGTPKTHKRRSVPFPAFLTPLIARACARKNPDDLVFAGDRGQHLKTPTIRENSWFDRALLVAELPSMTIHDLRHTAASLAVSAGANVKAVQKMLGHASAAMTLDTYTDLFDDDLDTVAVRLNEVATSVNVVKLWSESLLTNEFVICHVLGHG
jgi:integrase